MPARHGVAVKVIVADDARRRFEYGVVDLPRVMAMKTETSKAAFKMSNVVDRRCVGQDESNATKKRRLLENGYGFVEVREKRVDP